MKKRIVSGAGPAILELIIVIGLFSVFAALDLRIFAAAHGITDESRRLTHAVAAAESAAECFRAGIEPALYYDGEWLPTDEESAEYIVTVETSAQNGAETALVSVTDADGEIFSVSVKSPEAFP